MGDRYYSGGSERFLKEGSTPHERGVEFEGVNWDARVESLLKNHAPDLVKQMEFGLAVGRLLNHYSPEEVTPDVCEKFIDRNPQFSDMDPALVQATVIELSGKKKTPEEEKILH